MAKRFAYTLSILALTCALPVQAAEVSREIINDHIAEASFSTFSGCEDALVGVTVRAGVGGNASDASSVSVFGAFNDICEMGTSNSFFGSAPLEPGEFIQNGLTGARLEKTFSVSGHDIRLSLTWTGNGEVVSDRSIIRQNDGSTRIRGHERVSNRQAAPSGTFLVDGLNRISGNTVTSASLGHIRRNAVTIVR